MKQIFQDLKDGATVVEEVPRPSCPPNHLLIRTAASLISAGTERMLADFGRASYLEKARQQPDKVRQVLDKARTDGIVPTIEAVRAKLEEPVPMGYANAGYVIEVGDGVTGFEVGDLVGSNGPHAEVVAVPATLAAKAPAWGRELSPEEVAFSTVGAIALQSVRLAEPTIGERFTVSGLGLVGLMTVQLLQSAGCRVLGFDLDADRVQRAREFGASAFLLTEVDPVAKAMRFTDGQGIDGVIVAAATSSSEPIRQAAQMSRKRGRVILVGVAGLELVRSEFYEKELKFQVSCSYGPGRYDDDYETGGADYPFGYVRWTSARNQQTILEMLADDRLDVASLITQRHAQADAAVAYETLVGSEGSLGIVLDYPEAEEQEDPSRSVPLVAGPESHGSSALRRAPRIGFIGAGNFTRRILLPAVAETDAELVAIASRGGASASTVGRKFGFQRATTDVDELLAADDLDTVFITTRHGSHAPLVVRALESGKHVFVEKPLAITHEQLGEVEQAYASIAGQHLMVGFNRRFAPQVRAIANVVSGRGPMALTMTVNAGPVAPDSWLHDPEQGGGRIVGEVCHFIDLLRYIVGASISDLQATAMAAQTDDTAAVTMEFEDGSIASINYFANGHSRVPKERLEVFHRGRIAQLDNFRSLKSYGLGKLRPRRLLRQDKGHAEEVEQFVGAVARGGSAPIPVSELFEVSRWTLHAAAAAASDS